VNVEGIERPNLTSVQLIVPERVRFKSKLPEKLGVSLRVIVFHQNDWPVLAKSFEASLCDLSLKTLDINLDETWAQVKVVQATDTTIHLLDGVMLRPEAKEPLGGEPLCGDVMIERGKSFKRDPFVVGDEQVNVMCSAPQSDVMKTNMLFGSASSAQRWLKVRVGFKGDDRNAREKHSDCKNRLPPVCSDVQRHRAGRRMEVRKGSKIVLCWPIEKTIHAKADVWLDASSPLHFDVRGRDYR
jgi:hypothetical protein